MATAPPILEPLSTGDIIDRSIGIYRRNVRALLATVALPFLIGAFGWLLMFFAQTALEGGGGEETPAEIAMPVGLMFLGFGLWMLYGYLMVLVVGGLSRAVGDFVMLGEPITVGGAYRAIRTRLTDLTVGSLILAAGMAIGSMIAMAVFFLAILVVGLLTVAIQTMGLPQIVGGVVVVIVMLLAVGAVVLIVVPLLISRIVFIPQAIMIEGCRASVALSRSMSLGGKNWNRVLAILVFSYFASWSLAAAILAPLLLVLWLTGYLDFDLQTFDAVTGGINQFSSFLVVPVWSIAYTLLYFDSRVRKEGYDVDLLVRQMPAPPPPEPIRVPSGAPFPAPAPAMARVKLAPDGRCLRCGHYNLSTSRSCTKCGW